MTDEEFIHIKKLLDVTKKRRDALELQAALFGAAQVPSHIAVELHEAQESIERLEAKMRIVTVPQDIQQATGPEASIDVLRLNVRDMNDKMGTMWRYLEHMILEDRSARIQRYQDEDKKRKRGVWERRVIEFLLALGVIFAIYLAVH